MQASHLTEVITYIIWDRLVEGHFIVIVLQKFGDFDIQPFHRGWLFNWGPLNRDLTVLDSFKELCWIPVPVFLKNCSAVPLKLLGHVRYYSDFSVYTSVPIKIQLVKICYVNSCCSPHKLPKVTFCSDLVEIACQVEKLMCLSFCNVHILEDMIFCIM